MHLEEAAAVSGDQISVGDALTNHYTRHGLPADGGETQQWFRVRLGRLTLRLPNPPARRRAVFYHDVNHVLTGYDTAFSNGEVTIAAFEVGAGCRDFLMAWFINVFMMFLGLLIRPRSLFHAFVRGRRSTSIYRLTDDREAIRSERVSELRRQLLLGDTAHVPSTSDRLSFAVWAVVCFAAILSPVFLLILVLR